MNLSCPGPPVSTGQGPGRIGNHSGQGGFSVSIDDKVFEIVAERMGRTLDSVKQLWPRALVQLRQELIESS